MTSADPPFYLLLDSSALAPPPDPPEGDKPLGGGPPSVAARVEEVIRASRGAVEDPLRSLAIAHAASRAESAVAAGLQRSWALTHLPPEARTGPDQGADLTTEWIRWFFTRTAPRWKAGKLRSGLSLAEGGSLEESGFARDFLPPWPAQKGVLKGVGGGSLLEDALRLTLMKAFPTWPLEMMALRETFSEPGARSVIFDDNVILNVKWATPLFWNRKAFPDPGLLRLGELPYQLHINFLLITLKHDTPLSLTWRRRRGSSRSYWRPVFDLYQTRPYEPLPHSGLYWDMGTALSFQGEVLHRALHSQSAERGTKWTPLPLSSAFRSLPSPHPTEVGLKVLDPTLLDPALPSEPPQDAP